MYLQDWRKICVERKGRNQIGLRSGHFSNIVLNTEAPARQAGTTNPFPPRSPNPVHLTSLRCWLLNLLLPFLSQDLKIGAQVSSQTIINFCENAQQSGKIPKTQKFACHVFGILLSILRHQTGEGNKRQRRWIRRWLQTNTRAERKMFTIKLSRAWRMLMPLWTRIFAVKSLLVWRQWIILNFSWTQLWGQRPSY